MSGRVVIVLALALCAGCEVSFFGGEPVRFGGSDTGGIPAGAEARPCGEPDDARAARTNEDGCSERCRIEPGATEITCDAVTLGTPRENVATLDLGSSDGVVITLEICDPTGTVLQISDSPTADADGGDAGSSSHDADVMLVDTTLTVRASQSANLEPSSARNFVPASGCHERTIVIADQIVYLVEADAGLCGTGTLRIDPPTDDEGAPDAKWYLALGGTVDGAQSGNGLRGATLCFW
ncbi:hypothetical protein [Sandaracinus amylolyticus]|uniref:hypothetical protein n=1 Tax=Sandaracinus amylolyticus TaxID=927083 RepID=UPI001F185B88|nr:hypothetical protein [Sandaracinus amylolyticus]UJR79933.1 Hypothetical protein I5071_19730 [Sandaracinus amylolyticus]